MALTALNAAWGITNHQVSAAQRWRSQGSLFGAVV